MTEELGARIRSGVAWKAASQLTLQLSRMAVALILARLLAPGDWGLAAMVLVFTGFVVVFTDSALGTALIQRRELREEDRSTVFWASVAIGLVLAVVGIACAGPVASFYGEPEVRSLFVAISIGFLVTSLGTTHMALLARDMEFRLLELRQIAATVAGAILGIALALGGFGAWAIVGQGLAEATASTILLWALSSWRPSFAFSLASLRRLSGFAGNVFGENLLYQAGRNLANLLIGRFLGAASLGTYALATNVILVPFSRIAAPLQQVFFPAFARLGDDRARLADVWIRASRLVGAVSIPALVGLAVVAPDFVEVVLGSRWSGLTPLIQILAVVGIVQSLQTLSGEVLLALGQAGTLLRFTFVWFVGTVGAFVLGLRWDVVGVAACYTALTLLLEPVRTYLTTRALGISFWSFVRPFSGVVQAATLMGVTLVVARAALVAEGVPATARLVLLVALGLGAYAAAFLWRAPDVVAEIRRTAGRRRAATPRVEAREEPV
jgi:O-antigen/teichoic acid export membrane protein